MINKRDIEDYFDLEVLRMTTHQPFAATKTSEKFDVCVNVTDGGMAGQAGATHHGISRALLETGQDYRLVLKKVGFLIRDPRVKGRKKHGLKAARRTSWFSKR